MYYEIYVDSLFFLNFIPDLMILLLMNKILKCTATHLSLMAAAAFGAGMVCVIMLMPLPWLFVKLILMYVFVTAGMLQIAFRFTSIKAMLRAQILLYGLTFVMGGLMQWMSMTIPFVRKNRLKMTEIIGMSILTFFACSFAYHVWKQKRQEFVSVILLLNGEEVRVNALIDTGNGLVEPISGKPVSVIEKQLVGDIRTIKESASYCVIPYHCVGRTHGIMEGFRIPDMVIITEDRKITIENAVLGMCEGSISASGNYQMILNPKLLED